MNVLGIDPGLASTGWAILEPGRPPRLANYGCIRTNKSLTLPERLAAIFQETAAVIRENNPQVLAIEELFFAKNTKTAILVSQAIGVIKLAGVKAKIAVFGYTPLHVKMATVGYGQADKHQVEFMVKKILHRQEAIKPNHAADAVAVAITHLQHNPKLG